MVGAPGFEPEIGGLKVRCDTISLYPRDFSWRRSALLVLRCDPARRNMASRTSGLRAVTLILLGFMTLLL